MPGCRHFHLGHLRRSAVCASHLLQNSISTTRGAAMSCAAPFTFRSPPLRWRLARSPCHENERRDQHQKNDQRDEVVKSLVSRYGTAACPASVAYSSPSRSSIQPSSRSRRIFASLTLVKRCRRAMMSRRAQRRAMSSMISFNSHPTISGLCHWA